MSNHPYRLLVCLMHDGSRQFAALPESVSWAGLHDHLARLEGAVITDFITDHVVEAWIDFSYRGHDFAVNNQCGEYWFFVDDPECDDEILLEIVAYCQRLWS